MTELVKQRFDGDVQRKDCFLCCAAMVAGLTYDELDARFTDEMRGIFRTRGPKGEDECILTLVAAGFTKDIDYRVFFLLPEYASFGFLRNILWGRRALVQVRSKNYADEQHIVYWDGQELFDPSNKRRWKWSEVEPIYLWLFDEARRLRCV